MHKKLFSQLRHFKDIEKVQAIALLDDAERRFRPYDGCWVAPWLHSHIHSAVWLLNRRHGTRIVDDELTGAQQIDWGVALSDGSRLTDEKNVPFLHMLQKVAFLAREAPLGFKTPNSTTHLAFIRFLLLVARWIYLHKDIYNPEREMLKRIDGPALDDFFNKYSEGGATFVLRYPERILAALYERVYQTTPPPQTIDDPFSVPNEDLDGIKNWLKDNDYVTTSGRERVPYLRRDKIAEILDESAQSFSSSRLNAFLQFLTPDCSTPLLATDLRTECFSHCVPLWRDAIASRSSIGSLISILANWRQLFSLHRHLPNDLPPPECFKQKALTNLINRIGEKSAHTPWIPLKTALAYTNESLKWIHLYGDDLVSIFLDSYRHFHKEGLLDIEAFSTTRKARIRIERDKYILSRMPDTLKPLNISGYSRALTKTARTLGEYGDYSNLRSAPSLSDAIAILLGATIVLLGTTKPIRQGEICNLDRDCVTFVKGDGYWINHEQGKNNIEDVWAEDSRPIPVITAKALLLVRRLSDGIKEISGVTDSWLLKKLFVLPTLGSLRKITLMNKQISNRFLDLFCDYVNLPTDEHGRRWYVRVHETRKSFLITFFWCFRFASLDAARWIAGHSDAKHIYAYIQANFPGEELPALEAEYAARMMWDFDAHDDKGETDNVEELYSAVCRHFNVTRLSLVGEEDLMNWLTLQFEKGHFSVQPYSIQYADGAIRTQIAFKLSNSEETNG